MENFQNQILKSFEPAQLFKNKIWYIQFRYVDPYTNKWIQKRIKVNRIKNLKEREKYAKSLIQSLNDKLYNGWNPAIDNEAPKSYNILTDVIDVFIRAKKRELRKASVKSYTSFSNIFKKWINVHHDNGKDLYCLNFGKTKAINFLNDIYNSSNISTTTYNNYLRFSKVLFNWMEEQGYIKSNPFNGIKSKKKTQKIRKIINNTDRTRIQEYLVDNDKSFHVVTLLVFHCLLRPKEISMLKPKYFDFNNQVINLPGHVAKNGNPRIITIPDVIMEVLFDFNFNEALPNQFIWGKYNKPGNEHIDNRRFSKKWHKLRLLLGLEKESQLYSLRDTGIVEMLRIGISADEVMKQADHSSLEITTLYAKHYLNTGSEIIKKSVNTF